MRRRYWRTPDPIKNYFPMPNVIFSLELSPSAIAIYGYLLRIENRTTYQSYASCRTIGKAVRMSTNTVRKYVQELEEKQLISTEPTSVFTRDGFKRNGTLLYHIRPIRDAVEHYYYRQTERQKSTLERQRLEKLLREWKPAPQNAP